MYRKHSKLFPRLFQLISLTFCNVLTLLPGVAMASGAAAKKKFTVTVSHSGLVQLAEAIFPAGTEVHSFVPLGASAETFEPTPKAVLKVSESQYFFASAVPFEEIWLPKLAQSHQNTKVVTLFSFANAPAATHPKPRIEVPNSKASKIQKPEHQHAHDDPHFWLSPNNLQEAARVIAAELGKELDNGEKEQLNERLKVELASLEKLEQDLQALLKPYKGKSFFIFHPSWGEFASDFGLVQEALEKHGHSPTPKYMQSFLTLMKKEKAKTIFVQPQMSQREASAVAAQVGAKVQSVDPLALNLKAEMRKFAELLRNDFESRK